MKWIWANGSEKNNCYAEFVCKFKASGKTELKVGANYEYAAYVNGNLVSAGQYTNSAGVRTLDTADISAYVRGADNELKITAHHMKDDYQVQRASAAGVAFCVTCGDKTVAESGEQTDCRVCKKYYDTARYVTPQCGVAWGYDFTGEDGGMKKAAVINESYVLRDRPVKNFVIGKPAEFTVCAQGAYKENGGETAAEIMQNSYMRAYRFADMTGANRTAADCGKPLAFTAKDGDGIYIIIDLGRETAGYLTFDLSVEKGAKAMIGWGEHLSDLRVRSAVGGRNFGIEIKLKAGKNEIFDCLHRLGCRYLALYVSAPRVTLSRLTLCEATYPFAEISKDFGDRFLNKIYETGKRTLKLCAHVHYEDCPWREQALYGMDSRNQMLFGYGTFGEYELPRASLRLIAESIAADGLPELCPPARNTITIPSFALYFIIALGEHARAYFNKEFLLEMLPYAERMFGVFADRLDENGVKCFTEKRYWNFYEWVDGLDGGDIFRNGEISTTHDTILTALFAIAATELAGVHKLLKNDKRSEECFAIAEKATATLEKFYNAERGVYHSFAGESGEKFGLHGYTQAVAAMAGAKHAASAVKALMNPPADMGECTFATLQWKYDAVMKYAGDKEFCLNEICRVFGGMLLGGATSYWETERGESDFDDAGSLCHAWSAVPCYFMDKYLKSK